MNNDLADKLPLDGLWECSFDGHNGTLHVPGTWEAQGLPRRVDGPAHFRKTVSIPAGWQGKYIELQFDAVSYHAEVSVNGQSVGTHTGLWTPFAFDVTDAIHSGTDNEIALTVYKPGERFPMRQSLAGFLPDVSIPFGGIWQSARLVAFDGPALSDLTILSDLNNGSVSIKVRTHRATGLTAVIRLQSPDGQEVTNWRSIVDSEAIEATLVVPDPEAWQPDHPALYTIIIELEGTPPHPLPASREGIPDASTSPLRVRGGGRGVRLSESVVQARLQRRFGFRELTRQGDQLLLNGTSICLRGLLNWGWYPDILCPNPDEATIRDEFRRVRALGYNLVKLCLYVPSPRYFEIADEEGMLLWLELPMWLPQVTAHLRQQAPVEYADILTSVHTHPSIVIYSLGCELDQSVDADLLGQLNQILRDHTAGVLACDNSGSGEAYGGLGFDYADFNDYHFYCDLHYFYPLVDHFRRDWRPARPWIFGEFCDADDFRDLDELRESYGGVLPWWLTEPNPIHTPKNLGYHIQQQLMRQLDLPFDGQTLQRISRQQSFVIRKAILEKVRARAGMGGYVVTGMRDTPLATSSMFDDRLRMKYVADEFQMFNADTVLTLEQGRARLWTRGGDRPFPLDCYNHVSGTEVSFRVILSHTGASTPSGNLRWSLQFADGTVYSQGEMSLPDLSGSANPGEIATLQLKLPDVTSAQEITLSVKLGNNIRNQWPLWIYPPLPEWDNSLAVYDPAGSLNGLDDLLEAAQVVRDVSALDDNQLFITNTLTPDVQAFVSKGGKAILLQTGPGLLPADPCPFWRESIKLFYPHPIIDAFPQQGFANLQFYHLASDYAFNLNQYQTVVPAITEMNPILQRLDARLFTLRDYLVELKLGQGTLLASTLRFTAGAGDQVLSFRANIAGRFLMQQMIHYLHGL